MPIGQRRRRGCCGHQTIRPCDWWWFLNWRHNILCFSDVSEGVPNAGCDGLEVGDKFDVEVHLVVDVWAEVEHVVESLLHEVFEHEGLGDAGILDDLLDKLAALVEPIDVFLDLLCQGADCHLLRVERLIQLLQ